MRLDPLIKLSADVAAHGWHVLMVLEDDDGPGFAYTVGLTESFGHPEVLMAGLPLDTLHVLLNLIGERVRAQERFGSGHRVDGLLEGDYRCEMRAVRPAHYDDYVGQAQRYYGERRFDVLQCFWPDSDGRLPWEEGFDPMLRWAQPRLDL